MFLRHRLLLRVLVKVAARVYLYVALGDSFSSGVGTGSYTLDAGCKRSIYAYPYLLAQKRRHTTLDFAACSGATTDDVLTKQVASVTAQTRS